MVAQEAAQCNQPFQQPAFAKPEGLTHHYPLRSHGRLHSWGNDSLSSHPVPERIAPLNPINPAQSVDRFNPVVSMAIAIGLPHPQTFQCRSTVRCRRRKHTVTPRYRMGCACSYLRVAEGRARFKTVGTGHERKKLLTHHSTMGRANSLGTSPAKPPPKV